MADVVLDTGALADLLTQYFQSEDRQQLRFRPSHNLPARAVQQINRITAQGGRRYVVAASTMAFVELARKWDEIVGGRLQPYQMASFLEDPPDWFSIEPMDDTLIPSFLEVPARVTMPDGTIKGIEDTDAIHAATALSRERGVLVTLDSKLKQIVGLCLG